jgi:hypothetical protein
MSTPALRLLQQRRAANVAFVRKHRVVLRKLRAARPEVPPEVWRLVQQSAGDLFMHEWDAKARALRAQPQPQTRTQNTPPAAAAATDTEHTAPQSST